MPIFVDRNFWGSGALILFFRPEIEKVPCFLQVSIAELVIAITEQAIKATCCFCVDIMQDFVDWGKVPASVPIRAYLPCTPNLAHAQLG